MRMKRTIASLVAFMMVASVNASTASAAAGTVGITAGKVEAAAGADFSVNINLSAIPAPGVTTVDFAVEFDSSLVTITDVTAGALCNTGAAAEEKKLNAAMGEELLEWNVSGNQVCLVWTTGLTDTSYWMTGSGVFVTLKGTVKANATAGAKSDLKIVPINRDSYSGSGTANSEILIGYVDASNKAEAYTTTLTNGSVTVAGGAGATMYGDADCDGQVLIQDLVLLNSVASMETGYTLSAQGALNADCSYDGQVNSTDAIALQKYLVKVITYDKLGPQ